MATIFNKVAGFLGSRFPVEKMSYEAMVEKKEVPLHKLTWGYYTGGLTLFFFVIQVITGLMLLFYYQPTVTDAYISVKYINDYVKCGFLVRNAHAWSSSCMIFFAVVHLLVVFAMKSFEKPREVTWLAGVILLFITFTFGFTGYLLPWNQIAVNATKVGLQSVENIGTYLPGALSELPRMAREAFQGEAMIGQTTLGRFYALHVVILPFFMFLVLGIHLLSVQLHGMSQGIDTSSQTSERFFPIFLLKDLRVWTVAFFVLYVLSLCLPYESFLPFPLLEPYRALGATPLGIKPEWYFYFVYYPLELLPFWMVLLAMTILPIVLFLAPWIFKSTSRKALAAISIAAALYLVVITVFGDQIFHLLKG
jgi:cytochrome b6